MPRNTSGLKRTAGPGRPKGSLNKVSQTVKEMILQALADAGGAAYLKVQAEKNPTAFLSLIGRVLPLQVKNDGSEPMMPISVVHEYHDQPPS